MAELLSIKQVADYLHVSEQTVRKYIRDRELEASYIGNKHQIKQEWVEKLVENKRGKNKRMAG